MTFEKMEAKLRRIFGASSRERNHFRDFKNLGAREQRRIYKAILEEAAERQETIAQAAADKIRCVRVALQEADA